MNCIRFASIVLLAGGMVFAQAPAATDPSRPTPPLAIKSFDLSAIDKTADPCADFYQYACGNWVKEQPHSRRPGALVAVFLAAGRAQPLPAVAGAGCRRQ